MENNNTLMPNQNTIMNGLNLNLDKPEESQAVEVVTEQEYKRFMDLHKEQLKHDPMVIDLKGKVDITQPKAVLSFGKESSVAITTVSDRLLESIKAVKEEDANELLGQLTKIMKKINVKEIKEEGNFLSKIFNKTKRSVEELIARYESISGEVEGVYLTLTKYQAEIIDETEKLSMLYKGNMEYFRDLEKYVVAGEMIIEELETQVIPEYERHANNSSDPLAVKNVDTLRQCRDMISQRVYDLKLAENVALQNMPMIQQMQMGNFELLKTIESSFIVTLPMLKQGIIQAMLLKRQANRAKNINDLKEFTNDLVLQNAQNASRQAIELAKMGGQGIVDIDKLEQSFNIIQQGLKDAKKQQEENKKLRTSGEKKLEEMKYKALTQNDIKPSNQVTSGTSFSMKDLNL